MWYGVAGPQPPGHEGRFDPLPHSSYFPDKPEHVPAVTSVILPNGEEREIFGLGYKAADTVVNTILSTIGSTTQGTVVKTKKEIVC